MLKKELDDEVGLIFLNQMLNAHNSNEMAQNKVKSRKIPKCRKIDEIVENADICPKLPQNEPK